MLTKLGLWLCVALLVSEAVLLGLIGLRGQEQTLTSITSVLLSALIAVAAIEMGREVLTRRASTPVGLGPAPPATPPPRKPWEMSSVLASQAALAPFLLLPLWAEKNSPVHDRSDILICVVVLLALGLALATLGTAIYVRPKSARRRSWAVFLALLPLASSIEFWYTTIYKPAHNRPDINVVASVKQLSTTSGNRQMEAEVTISNDGPAVIDFFDAVYTLTAFRGSSLKPTELGTNLSLGPHHGVAWADSASQYEGVLKVGRLIRPGGHLAPGQDLETSFAFDVADFRKGKIRLTVFLDTIVDPGSNRMESADCAPPTAAALCERAPIPIAGWVSSRLLDHPIAQTYLHAPRGEVPYLTTGFQYADAPREPAHDGYGILNSRGFTTSVECELKAP